MGSDQKYDASQIQVIEGRDAVRLRPGMYIGGKDSAAMHHLVWEIVDNSVDEALNGHATEIKVTLHKDSRTICIKDDGRGIPVGLEKKTQRPAVEIVFDTLHSGGKFAPEGGSYKSSGGLNGVGAAITNFLSTFLHVKVYRDLQIHELRFEQGYLTQELEVTGTYQRKTKNLSGTEVTFSPDPEIFGKQEFNSTLLQERLKIKTYINPGLRIVFEDLTSDTVHTYEHPRGIQEYLEDLMKDSEAVAVHDSLIYLESPPQGKGNIRYEVAMQWTEDTKDNFKSFVNSIPTSEGGTHEAGFRDGISKALRAFMDNSNEVPKKTTVRAEDLREGLKVIINVFTEGEIQFQSQNKVKLNNPEIQTHMAAQVKAQMETFLYANSSTGDLIVRRILAAVSAREASRSTVTKKVRKRNARKLILPGKLSDCSSNVPEDCEIFLVEGDSAGGNAKVARDRSSQAILPLRGKVLNAETATMAAVLKNKELSGIIEALGCGIGDQFRPDKLRYHKVILLMDADSDGHHISTLLLTFFYKVMPQLIERGHIYIAAPPLYRVMHGKDRHWAETDAELQDLLKDLEEKDARKKVEISRFKGLGEMMAATLKETALNRQTRNLIQIEIPEGLEKLTRTTMENLMGKDAQARQDMIVNTLTDLGDLDY